MTAEEILQEAATMHETDWLKIQAGIAEMLTARLSGAEVAEIEQALREADVELARGEELSGPEMRQHFSLS